MAEIGGSLQSAGQQRTVLRRSTVIGDIQIEQSGSGQVRSFDLNHRSPLVEVRRGSG